jgi:hypothetical protein
MSGGDKIAALGTTSEKKGDYKTNITQGKDKKTQFYR